MKQKVNDKDNAITKSDDSETIMDDSFVNSSMGKSSLDMHQNGNQNHVTKFMTPIFERIQQLLAMLDKRIEKRVQNGRLSPEVFPWWLIVKPDTMHEYYAQLDEEGKEELDNIRFSNYNVIFWLPMLLSGVWISSIIHDMSLFADNFIYLFIEGSFYQSLLDHWGWLLMAITVSCLGARKRSESMSEKLARIPGLIAVAILVMVLMNATAGIISGRLLNGRYFIILGAIAFAVMYGIMSRISEEDPEISISESSGVLVGWLVGIALNTQIFDIDIVIFSAVLIPMILSLGVALAKAIKKGWTWAGWLALVALVISWMTISCILLWNSGNELLSIISKEWKR